MTGKPWHSDENFISWPEMREGRAEDRVRRNAWWIRRTLLTFSSKRINLHLVVDANVTFYDDIGCKELLCSTKNSLFNELTHFFSLWPLPFLTNKCQGFPSIERKYETVERSSCLVVIDTARWNCKQADRNKQLWCLMAHSLPSVP